MVAIGSITGTPISPRRFMTTEMGLMAMLALMMMSGGLLLGWIARMIEDGEAHARRNE